MLKDSFKYYKRKYPPPCLNDVIDFSKEDLGNEGVIGGKCLNSVNSEDLGIRPSSHWKLYYLKDSPGFIFIRDPFTPLGQRYWIRRCLKNYTQKPNRLNLDAHGDIGKHEEWWSKCRKDMDVDGKLLRKLRWATLGYHHNWDTKVYEESARDVFPDDLALLSQQVATAVGFTNFCAQAAIVNYYHMDSTLSCHTDHSEFNLEAPLLSFSFGQSAIFLLGGKTKEEKPVAMMIHSGDIVIMSGESRLCYHGIPAIIPAPYSPWNLDNLEDAKIESTEKTSSLIKGNLEMSDLVRTECSSDELWKPFEEYISSSRINMNVRQVLPFGCDTLPNKTT